MAKKNSLAAMPQEVQMAVTELEKNYGKGSIMRLGEGPVWGELPPQVSMGCLSLDLAMGIIRKHESNKFSLGPPRGRVMEILGPEASGKTTLANHLIANAQRSGSMAAMIDMEQSWSRRYAASLGVDVPNLVFSQPDDGEQALKTAHLLVKTGKFGVIVVDSIAALVPRKEVEEGIGADHMAMQARMMSQTLRIMNPDIRKSNTLLVFTNQMREKVGVVFGNPETTPGGNAMKFYASFRLDIRKKEVIKDSSGTPIGHNAKVRIIKNKLASPFAEAEFRLMYGVGIDAITDVIECGIKAGIVERSGSWIKYKNEPLGQGMESARSSILENPKILDEITLAVLNQAYDEENPIVQATDKVPVQG